MSLMDRIDKDYQVSGSEWIVWKELQDKDALPLSFLFKVKVAEERHFEASGKDALVIVGDASLFTRGFSTERLEHLQNVTGIPITSTVEKSFFLPGSMFSTQMVKAFGDEWMKDCVGSIIHIRYSGKKPNPKNPGQEFHQVFIDVIPEKES